MTSDKTKLVYATLEYNIGNKPLNEELVVEVPANFQIGQWLAHLSSKTRELLKPKGVKNGTLNYRLDGSNEPVTAMERVKNRLFIVTGRGAPVTGSRFVPIWPDPPPSPR